MPSNHDRLKFLRQRVNDLARLIQDRGSEKEFVEYLSQVGAGAEAPDVIDELTWDVMLPAEQDAKLFVHYHTVRTELLSLMRKAEEPTTLERVSAWLESPWVRTAIATATLTEAAGFLYQILTKSGLFLTDATAADELRT